MEMLKPLPPKEEWDFSLNDKHDWGPPEWEACYYYEYARESKVCRESVAVFRKKIRGRSFEAYWSSVFKPFRRDRLPRNRCSYALFNYCPEWPSHPFLSIPSKERRERLARMPTRRSTALEQRDLNAVIAHNQHLAAPNLTPDQMRAFVKGEYTDPVSNGRTSIATAPGRELVCFEIDWRDGKTEIARCFEAWLLRAEPAPKVNVCYRPDNLGKLIPAKKTRTVLGGTLREHRGKGSPTAQFQACLKALGAWRIWRHYGGHWLAILGAVGNCESPLGSQFHQPSAWARARKKAEGIIAGLDG